MRVATSLAPMTARREAEQGSSTSTRSGSPSPQLAYLEEAVISSAALSGPELANRGAFKNIKEVSWVESPERSASVDLPRA